MIRFRFDTNADVNYGVTMGRDSASQVISLKLDEVTDEFIGRT